MPPKRKKPDADIVVAADDKTPILEKARKGKVIDGKYYSKVEDAPVGAI